MYSQDEIKQYIPQREPFLFLNEVIELDPDRFAKGVLHLSGDEPFFRRTLPGRKGPSGRLDSRTHGADGRFHGRKIARSKIYRGKHT